MLGENVQDYGGTVDDFHLNYVFQSSPLGGLELGIYDYGVGVQRRYLLG